ncbi:ABC transporter permease [Staphylococcus piscifermentans]|uniref:Putative hemin transport system permease protein HrtB n=1 Tax=Staphylococcus piscifermentans TaxID=70258 RepID=A0A239TP62_9STAP|nr:ABC transporter permease [Staphylococcus piscifermentans]RTX85949.1 ABC transporter permease [Staphylococcus piscifermentans]GEP85604.1 putative hemin transport system permease protein HrtB [Staphylococcus piscifermentans]SNU99617.1 ABC transporter permease [Staphylococcus piscifermentans]
MKLAWKEMTFYKFKFILIMLIILLLSSMVLFISGLAQGLGRENISMLNNMQADKFVVQDIKQPVIEKSIIKPDKQSDIENIINEKPFKLGQQTMISDQTNDLDILLINPVKDFKPALTKGHYPQSNNEIAVNKKLTGEGLKIGDKVKMKGHGEAYKIVGIMNDTMYSHSSAVMTTNHEFDQLMPKAASFYPVKHMTKAEQHKLNDISGIKVVSEKTLTDNIPSYNAEQAPLNMMIISLFFITAIVLSAFFYVMTIQKISEIGILKAIGIRTRHLLWSLVFQILLVTMMSVVISVLIISVLSMFMPVTMPFHITITNMLLVIGVFILVAIIGASLSFIKLVKVNPIQAIGGEA